MDPSPRYLATRDAPEQINVTEHDVSHLTCWFWKEVGRCKWGDQCRYSHRDTGYHAAKPEFRGQGRSVAGRNAASQTPKFRRWQGIDTPGTTIQGGDDGILFESIRDRTERLSTEHTQRQRSRSPEHFLKKRSPFKQAASQSISQAYVVALGSDRTLAGVHPISAQEPQMDRTDSLATFLESLKKGFDDNIDSKPTSVSTGNVELHGAQTSVKEQDHHSQGSLNDESRSHTAQVPPPAVFLQESLHGHPHLRTQPAASGYSNRDCSVQSVSGYSSQVSNAPAAPSPTFEQARNSTSSPEDSTSGAIKRSRQFSAENRDHHSSASSQNIFVKQEDGLSRVPSTIGSRVSGQLPPDHGSTSSADNQTERQTVIQTSQVDEPVPHGMLFPASTVHAPGLYGQEMSSSQQVEQNNGAGFYHVHNLTHEPYTAASNLPQAHNLTHYHYAPAPHQYPQAHPQASYGQVYGTQTSPAHQVYPLVQSGAQRVAATNTTSGTEFIHNFQYQSTAHCQQPLSYLPILTQYQQHATDQLSQFTAHHQQEDYVQDNNDLKSPSSILDPNMSTLNAILTNIRGTTGIQALRGDPNATAGDLLDVERLGLYANLLATTRAMELLLERVDLRDLPADQRLIVQTMYFLRPRPETVERWRLEHAGLIQALDWPTPDTERDRPSPSTNGGDGH